MNWNNCFSHDRIGLDNSSSSRTQYQRDFDRLIFSTPFRRLQNKTQVFPMPGNTFVHNRLTHSLEVASVGRSLGHLIGNYISANEKLSDKAIEFYKYDLSSVIAAGCLAHDLGNPPFGHSGEDAISSYFINNSDKNIENTCLSEFYSNHEWSDLTNFEGNANALHILTNKYPGKLQGGLSLTNSTLASILKYPCHSKAIDKNKKHLKKYGYLQKDINIITSIAKNTNMIKESEDSHGPIYKRHPFVYLVEAADDICYRIIDIEDAHRINILSTQEVIEIFIDILSELNILDPSLKKTKETLNKISDKNEKVSYLRAKTIDTLVKQSYSVFIKHKDQIIEGEWNNTLIDHIENTNKSLSKAKSKSIEKIYNHPSVIQIEIAGYNILYELLNIFIPLVLKTKLTSLEKKTVLLIPSQYKYTMESNYKKTLGIVDFISGMTDGYATEFYRKSKGIIVSSIN